MLNYANKQDFINMFDVKLEETIYNFFRYKFKTYKREC